MRKRTKYIAAVAAAAGLFAAFTFSAADTFLVCEGAVEAAGTPPAEDKAYLWLSEYRWWANLWSDSQGYATVRFDKAPFQLYFDGLRRVGEGEPARYTLLRGDQPAGDFRAEDNTLLLSIPNQASEFTGRCSEQAPAASRGSRSYGK